MARAFNGVSDKIQTAPIGGGAVLSPPAITISAWANLANLSINYAAVVIRNLNDTPGTGGMYYVAVHNANFVYYFNQANNVIDPGAKTLLANTWYHVAATYDSVNGLLTYVNGVSDGTSPAAGPLPTFTTRPAFIGDDPLGAFFAGDIYDVAIWNTPLSKAQIGQLYSGGGLIKPNNIQPANLVGWWPLDGKSSPEPDLSGNGNNGILTGTTFAPDPLFPVPPLEQASNFAPSLQGNSPSQGLNASEKSVLYGTNLTGRVG